MIFLGWVGVGEGLVSELPFLFEQKGNNKNKRIAVLHAIFLEKKKVIFRWWGVGGGGGGGWWVVGGLAYISGNEHASSRKFNIVSLQQMVLCLRAKR